MSLQQYLPTPAAGFDMPLAILTACHERILRFCDMLEQMAEHMQQCGIDTQAQEAAKLIHRYFSSAGQHHHQDEEEDLFPLLLQHDPSLQELLLHLQQTHREMDALWQQLEPMLLAPEQIEIAAFRPLAEQFSQGNRLHLQLENRELLPRAATLLSQAEQETLGRAMARRRGVRY